MSRPGFCYLALSLHVVASNRDAAGYITVGVSFLKEFAKVLLLCMQKNTEIVMVFCLPLVYWLDFFFRVPVVLLYCCILVFLFVCLFVCSFRLFFF